MTKEIDIRVMHFYSREADVSLKVPGGVTVAYSWEKKNSFILLSTAVCSKHDNFNRKVGHTIAVENFLNSKYIMVPFDRKVWKNPRNMLREMFANVVEKNGLGRPEYVGMINIPF